VVVEVSEVAVVVGVVPVLLLRSPDGPPGDVVVVSSEFPAVAVTASAGELVVRVEV
jgi:hypothetical protein